MVRRRSSRLLVAALATGVLMTLVPAQAGSALSACTLSLHFTFASNVGPLTGATTYTMSGAGTCETSDGLGKTVDIAAQGNATQARCASLVLTGTYVLNVFPAPAPASSNGIFNVAGTASAAVTWLSGFNPTLVGVGVLVGPGLISCVGGTQMLTYTAVFGSLDP